MAPQRSLDVSEFIPYISSPADDEEGARYASRVVLVETTEPLSVEAKQRGDRLLAVSGADETFLTHVRDALAHEASFRDLATRAEVEPDDLMALLAKQFTQVPLSGSSKEAFSRGEADALTQASVDLSAPSTGAAVQVTTAVRFARVLRDSLTVAATASTLKVSAGRIRQRIADGSLYAIRMNSRGEWRLPRWQFTSGGLLPGLEIALKGLPKGLHPLAVEHLVTTPTPDLELAGESRSPIDWLASGGDPNMVAELLDAAPAAP